MARNEYYHYITDGGLFYDNLGDIGGSDKSKAIWESLRIDAYKRFDTVTNVDRKKIKSFQQIGQSLMIQGERELKREINVLEKMFGAQFDSEEILKSPNGFAKLIKAFNQVLNIESMYKKAIEQIRLDTRKSSSIEDSAARLMGSYTEKSIKDNIEILEELALNYTNGQISKEFFESNFKQFSDYVLENAFNNLTKEKLKDGQDNPFFPLQKAMEKTLNFKQEFKIDLFKRYGFDRIQQAIEKGELTTDFLDFKKEVIGKVNSNLKSSSVAGFVQELLVPAIAKEAADNFAYTIERNPLIKSVRTGSLKGGGIASTDIIHTYNIYQAEQTLSANFENNKIIGTSKSDIRQDIENFVTNISTELDNGAIIYESTKEYNLGMQQKTDKINNLGFHGTTYTRKSLIDLLKELNFYRSENFVNALMNSAEGAILYTWRGGMLNIVTSNIAEAMGAMLFDNYTIKKGSGNDSIIHVFRLSNIVVPLSYLLYNAGKAYIKSANDALDWVEVTPKYPKRKYSNDYYKKDIPSSEKTFDKSIERWEEQVKENDTNFSVHIKFLQNFTEYLKGDLGDILLKQE